MHPFNVQLLANGKIWVQAGRSHEYPKARRRLTGTRLSPTQARGTSSYSYLPIPAASPHLISHRCPIPVPVLSISHQLAPCNQRHYPLTRVPTSIFPTLPMDRAFPHNFPRPKPNSHISQPCMRCGDFSGQPARVFNLLAAATAWRASTISRHPKLGGRRSNGAITVGIYQANSIPRRKGHDGPRPSIRLAAGP